jgi:hypothetical protein
MTSTVSVFLSFILRCLAMAACVAVASTIIYFANGVSETLGFISFLVTMPGVIAGFYYIPTVGSNSSVAVRY